MFELGVAITSIRVYKGRMENEIAENITKAVDESGYKRSFIAGKLGISNPAFGNKLKGRFPFRVTEVIIMAALLRMSTDQLLGVDADKTA